MYSITSDICYNQWLQATHPDNVILAHLPTVSQGTVVQFSSGMTTFTRTTESVSPVSGLLKLPAPPPRHTSQTKSVARVLTSAESLKLMEEKEKKKQAKEAEKAERKNGGKETNLRRGGAAEKIKESRESRVEGGHGIKAGKTGG